MSYPQQQPAPPPYTPPPPPPAPRKPKRWGWILGIIGALLLGIIIGNAGNAKTGSNSARETVTVRVPADGTAPAAPAETGAAPAQTGPATTMGNGTYQVGIDVQPGQYKTAGPEGTFPCYWARLKDDSGAFEAIIANGTPQGPSSLTINQGEFVELSGDCTWNKVG